MVGEYTRVSWLFIDMVSPIVGISVAKKAITAGIAENMHIYKIYI